MTESIFETVSYDRDHGIRTISLYRPECLNAMNATLLDDVARAFEAVLRVETEAVVDGFMDPESTKLLNDFN